ncbi:MULTISPECIES: alpha/beta fold hydrolase [Geobacillus]|uniref:alpha/beta fold hydrolase n=1 Tax=Geobacillus TaxID=129337 RepID=UPI001681BDD9|nr:MULTISPECIES: alpha/beta hydrolase [Geobacillus]MCG6795763.1 alpha/beta fold hydrolase [Geobacillus sp. YHL]QNU26240.1 alpha/beta fold hydrolase [Geobacillus zalihae]
MNIVCIPGWGMKAGIFAPLLDSLSLSGNVTAVEWKGIETIHCFRKRAEQALQERAAVIGWSLGSLVALELAHAYPERVSRLILIGGTSRFVAEDGYEAGWHPRIVKRMKTQLQARPADTIAAFLASLWSKSEEGDISAFFYCDRVDELLIGLDYLVEADARPFLPDISAPMLVVHGEQDVICPPAAARYIAERAPNATMALLPDTGHVPFWTQTETCVHLIQTWVGETDD